MKSHCGDKTILWPSYLHNRISYTGKMASLYWVGALVTLTMTCCYFAICNHQCDLEQSVSVQFASGSPYLMKNWYQFSNQINLLSVKWVCYNQFKFFTPYDHSIALSASVPKKENYTLMLANTKMKFLQYFHYMGYVFLKSCNSSRQGDALIHQ